MIKTLEIGYSHSNFPNCPHPSYVSLIFSISNVSIDEDDFGLSPTYLHLYRWLADKCQGKEICGPGTLPEWWTLTGEIKDNAGGSRMCPQSGTKYFTGILLHMECLGKGLLLV